MSQSETAPFTFVYLAMQTWMGNTPFYPISARMIDVSFDIMVSRHDQNFFKLN